MTNDCDLIMQKIQNFEIITGEMSDKVIKVVERMKKIDQLTQKMRLNK